MSIRLAPLRIYGGYSMSTGALALQQTIFGKDAVRRELAAVMAPEDTGDEPSGSNLAQANVGELFWYTLPELRIDRPAGGVRRWGHR